MSRVLKFLIGERGRIAVSAVLFAAALITEWLSQPIPALCLYIAALLYCGGAVFVDAVRGILRRDLLDEKFLMSIASIGAMIVGEWSEGVAVMLFFLVGEAFEHAAVKRSRNSIKALMSIRPDEACVLTDGEEQILDADEVEVGSTILIRPGERVPLDCTVVSGTADVDTSAMTGEALPRPASVGTSLDSGVILLNGTLTCVTTRTADDSAASRILELVENASENKSREESFITRFSRFYTPIVVALALLLAILLPVFNLATVEDAIYRALMFLVISCPCALVISVPMAFFGGIGGAAARGILFKGGNVFSGLSRADTVALDKTGTITTGSFKVTEVTPIGISDDRLRFLAASAEQHSNHPIAAALREMSQRAEKPSSLEEIAGEGVIATVSGDTVAVGNPQLMQGLGVTVDTEEQGTILVALNGVHVGRITVSDEPKREAESALSHLRKIGVKRLAMISGDRHQNAQRTATAVGIDEVYSQLSPEQKYDTLRKLISESESTVYVGDGINDAPALALADVGIAMGGIGQDSAIEAADIVIMTDDLSKIPEAKLIATRTVGIAKFNIAFALGVKLLIMILGAFNLANMWLAVFADVGVAVLAILNAMRTLIVGKSKK